jgi:hypothetical protein
MARKGIYLGVDAHLTSGWIFGQMEGQEERKEAFTVEEPKAASKWPIFGRILVLSHSPLTK